MSQQRSLDADPRATTGTTTPQAPKAAAPTLSVIVPTRNEEGNIELLCELLDGVAPGRAVEVIVVDDSDDGTPDAVLRAAAVAERSIRLIHRPAEHRIDGLGGAVVAGMRQAEGDWVCVMDGDLQHPPALVEEMWDQALDSDHDLVVASRFRAGGDADQFGPVRRALSRSAERGARLLFGRRLRDISDPMSGFFLIRRAAVDLDRLRPRGFKILLEIAVRTPDLRVSEVGFHFGERVSGESKAGAREAARYAGQLLSARLGDGTGRLARFALVGLTGLAVNTLALALLTSGAGIYYALSAILATQLSTAWNYVLTDGWVFRGRATGRGAGQRAAMYFATNNAAMLIRIPLLLAFTSGLGIHYLLSNVLSLASLTLLRFAVADAVIWRPPHPVGAERRSTAWAYDVHGLISVESPVALPELERFLVDELVAPPTIVVHVGSRRHGTPAVHSGGETPPPTRFRYTEVLGPLGFEVDLEIGQRVGIRASRLLGRSPHVLYTNVVEPIIRWKLAEAGYALVHAACIANGDRATLITAQTDTGKTTTSLKLLDRRPYRFLSDDLTLLCPDGRVLTYPKPLTISRHTLHAVKRPLLNRRERIGLVLQSRLHSRSGRRFAFLLAKTHAPAATINAITQLLVPPPKYQVDRLVPSVQIAREAIVERLVVIQRGSEATLPLGSREALSILLDNCEDAYGFPPYADIEHLLHSRDGATLQAVERRTISQALSGAPATLLRSDSMNWGIRMLALLGPVPVPPAAEPAGDDATAPAATKGASPALLRTATDA
ncbi:MAG: Undecaprenyl-phosphate mannosyltransferase [Conexibacter sp.]|nr:Undecaprenyl-phosphate mannosyltransferase [Conexibacter sp.]